MLKGDPEGERTEQGGPPDAILEATSGQWCSTLAAHLNLLGGFAKLRTEFELVEDTAWALGLCRAAQVIRYAAQVDIRVLGALSGLTGSTLQLGNKTPQLAPATPGKAVRLSRETRDLTAAGGPGPEQEAMCKQAEAA